MTFADPRELRRRKIAALRAQLANATTDEDRARINAELHELTRFRLLRFMWPSGPHGRT
jgi:hypothetical protein